MPLGWVIAFFVALAIGAVVYYALPDKGSTLGLGLAGWTFLGVVGVFAIATGNLLGRILGICVVAGAAVKAGLYIRNRSVD